MADVAPFVVETEPDPPFILALHTWVANGAQRHKRRVLVVASDEVVARNWAKYRNFDSREWFFVVNAQQLYGVTDQPDDFRIVKLRGCTQHPRWAALQKRLAVIAAHEVPIVEDALPKALAKAAPTIGGVTFSAVAAKQLPREKNQGDTFILETGGRVFLSREIVEDLVGLLGAFLSGEPVPDPAALHAARIRAAILETGDPYAQPKEPEE